MNITSSVGAHSSSRALALDAPVNVGWILPFASHTRNRCRRVGDLRLERFLGARASIESGRASEEAPAWPQMLIQRVELQLEGDQPDRRETRMNIRQRTSIANQTQGAEDETQERSAGGLALADAPVFFAEKIGSFCGVDHIVEIGSSGADLMASAERLPDQNGGGTPVDSRLRSAA